MYWLLLFIGVIVGANISFLLYAIIFTGKEYDESLNIKIYEK